MAKKKRSKKAVPKKLQKRNARIGLRPGEFTMQVNFRRQGDTAFLALMIEVQELYRKGWFSQYELAKWLDLSPSLVAKIVRCDPNAPKQGPRKK